MNRINNNVKVICGTLAGIMIGAITIVGANQAIQAIQNTNIKVSLNGQVQTFKDETTGEIQYPITYNDRTYLPLRNVAQLSGLSVDYDNSTNTATLNTYYNSNDYVLLYYGYMPIEPKVGMQKFITDDVIIKNTPENVKKYVVPYYSYHSDGYSKYIENPEFISTYGGITLDNLSKFSVSKNINLMPRHVDYNYEYYDYEKEELYDFYKNIKNYYAERPIFPHRYQPDSCKIDLNGDQDYIYVYRTAEKMSSSGDISKYDKVAIKYDAFDKNGNHITTLLSDIYDKTYIIRTAEDEKDYTLVSLRESNVVDGLDIDNDSRMELVIEASGYEFESLLYIYKYENGKFIGETNAQNIISP